ncbi:hypothetical protein BDV29DRAFT_165110 [Aspergillus leporis]|uniref:Transmembrane protein n=1 Tax=Aspergillus leporis TaxID=41062 RepID=A0A5N5XEQ6_9EURO|nr:hypothetical protein BDV29DRAFT_165110 [Aspergillus leporis]
MGFLRQMPFLAVWRPRAHFCAVERGLLCCGHWGWRLGCLGFGDVVFVVSSWRVSVEMWWLWWFGRIVRVPVVRSFGGRALMRWVVVLNIVFPSFGCLGVVVV